MDFKVGRAMSKGNWYLIISKPQKEFFVETAITENLSNVEVYCPKYKRKGKVKPFFPGYLFVRFDDEKFFSTIKYTIGVKNFLSVEGNPLIVPEEIINKIKENEEDGLVKIKRKNEKLKKGDRVRIEDGALKGMEGIFYEELKDSERVKILVSSLLVWAKKEDVSKVN